MKFLEVQEKEGYIRDEILEAGGITPDTDNNGNIVRRDFCITSEHRHRAKTVNHLYQQIERQKILEAANNSKQQKHSTEMAKRQTTLQANSKCEELVLQAYLIDGNIESTSVAVAALQHFADKGINANMLKAFIHARKFASSEKDKGYKFPNKKTLQDAENGEDCLILQAFNLRKVPIKLVLSEFLIGADSADAEAPTTVGGSTLDEIIRYYVGGKDINNYYFTITTEWLATLARAFPSLKKRQANKVLSEINMEELQQQSNILFNALWNRFSIHLLKSDKPDHYCWEFTRINLSRLCAFMVFGGYITKNFAIDAKHMERQLLCGHDKMEMLVNLNYEKVNEESNFSSGVYNTYHKRDEHDYVGVRSGQSQCMMHTRTDTHHSCSKLTTNASMESKFYTSYPSKSSTKLATLKNIEGYFEDLVFTLLVGYDGKSAEAHPITSDPAEGGLFIWTTAVKNSLKYITTEAEKSLQFC